MTTGPLALITGGQQGIGLGIAEALSRAGFRVVLVSDLPPDAPPARAALHRLGDRASYFRHDIADTAAIPGLLDRIVAAHGGIDCLISNAGVPARVRGDLLDMLPENFDWTMSVNLRGTFFLAQEVARRMIADPGEAYRSLIFVTSISASMVSTERGEYCMSKAGAAMMAQLFAARLAGDGIGVFDLRPGIIRSGMTEKVAEKYDRMIGDGLVPAGRWGKPADLGRIVVPLALGLLDFANGAVIPADGGLSIPRL
ncbi:3-ketoacyl-ACP reductase [Paracoccus caeni]|uniref:3-ketoacyl-ACP reductase n=1 Tax=Paracoccus caeni TaxID=657651 RepID=A0A934SH10_9RHOB|nr:3-ketoacyl-ACP reductase [Paracoccus caeni]MBK4215242.1 3-ketoacyl-ACP reductase [Paracoccus caeni]